MRTKKIISLTLITSMAFTIFISCFHANDTKDYQLKTVKNISDVYPIIILGGGVAGLTAANYLAQANIPTVLVEGDSPGGALAQSHSVRNWPGVIDQPGATIVESLKQQAEKSGVKIVEGKAVSANFKTWPFEFGIESATRALPEKIQALSCIIATGAEPNYLGIPGEQGDNGYWGRGVTNCAVCDGPLYRGLSVAVVGGGDAAIEEVSYLAGIAQHVTLFVRSNKFRAKDLKKKEEVLSLPNVSVVMNTKLTEIVGDGNMVTQIKTLDMQENKTSTLNVDGVFLAIGSKPNTAIFKNQLRLDPIGNIVLLDDQQTSVKGVFAAGDVCDPIFRQAVTSAGQGCKAALQAQKFIDDLGFKIK